MEESPVDREMLRRTLPKLDYAAILQASANLTTNVPDLPTIPPQYPENLEDESLLASLHTVLFDVHVIEGHLVCPDTGRKFPIKDGIPNMILHEDEL